MMTTDEHAAMAAEITRQLRRELPDAIAKYNRNPHHRFIGGTTISVDNGPARRVLPEIKFDGRTEIWVGCHQDQHGSPLVCISVVGQVVPIATVDGLEGLIRRYREAS